VWKPQLVWSLSLRISYVNRSVPATFSCGGKQLYRIVGLVFGTSRDSLRQADGLSIRKQQTVGSLGDET